MRRTLTKLDRHVVKLEARVRDLERENEWLRAMSSSGFARGLIKPAPSIEWTPAAEEEDLL
ncbi:hypothetical protein GCM10011390_19050 [Aureimonas endophytica]|uniref:Transposase n=1 Tax=Aureimonas endophytica TaxID=2027858 RepID=A0A916ZJ25_9HYPH|nr:hypothetical protein [Aureimonas endophytica]GGE00425.1 hypothetical protein GCM10011390_19050 [Aureimonas endophytica]